MSKLCGRLVVFFAAIVCGTLAHAFDGDTPLDDKRPPALFNQPDDNRLSTRAAEGGQPDPAVKPERPVDPQTVFLRLPSYPQNIRQPMGVHVYYGPDKQLLLRQLASLDEPQALPPVPGVAKVYLAPWGSIDKALPVAAKVYRHIRDNGGARTLILVSRAHCEDLRLVASVWPNGAYATPVALTNINAIATMKLLKNPLFKFDANAHGRDASIETNVLLIQHFLPEATIVPVLIAPRDKEEEIKVAQALAEVTRPEGAVMIVISNLAYGLASENETGDLDLKTLTALSTMDLNIINNTCKFRDARMLPNSGIMDSPRVVMAGVLAALQLEMDTATWLGHTSVRQIPYAPLFTGCVAGAFSERSAVRPRPAEELLQTVSGRLSPEAENELIQIVRDSLESAAAQARYDTPYPKSPELLKKRAVYVTVFDENGTHLASMGFLGPQQRLLVAASEAARMCALGEDPQMPQRLSPEQAQRCKVIVSILRDFKTADNWTQVKNGDGIVIAKNGSRCTVLPCTARAHRWNEEDMLSFASKRAGMRPDAYRLPTVDIFTFQTDEYLSPAKK